MDFFQINFYVRVPLNNTKNHFHKENTPEKPIFGPYSMIIMIFGLSLAYGYALHCGCAVDDK